jgi:hypothetical protein
MNLTSEDRQHLASLETRLDLIRDTTRGVAEGYHTGAYIFGEGGIGKSWTVEQELLKHKVDYVLHNSRMTGAGLFQALKECPDRIHVLEDCESLLRDGNAAGVLRSALWSNRGSAGPKEW